MREFHQGLARVNWKAFRELAKPEKKTSWTWQKPAGRGSVRFTPNPSTTPKLVRVKLSAGRKAKLFRAPKVKVEVIKDSRDTAQSGDKLACTVNALAVVTGTPWVIAQKAMERAGRQPSRCFLDTPAIKAGKINGFKFASILRKPVSIAKFLEKHPIGKFYCSTSTHAFAVINGVVHNTTERRWGNRVVTEAYTVKIDGRE